MLRGFSRLTVSVRKAFEVSCECPRVAVAVLEKWFQDLSSKNKFLRK